VDVLIVGWTSSRPFTFVFSFFVTCILFLSMGYQISVLDYIRERKHEESSLQQLIDRLQVLSKNEREKVISKILNSFDEFINMEK
jgi:hypothetical protein